jgi:hypothetical protein
MGAEQTPTPQAPGSAFPPSCAIRSRSEQWPDAPGPVVRSTGSLTAQSDPFLTFGSAQVCPRSVQSVIRTAPRGKPEPVGDTPGRKPKSPVQEAGPPTAAHVGAYRKRCDDRSGRFQPVVKAVHAKFGRPSLADEQQIKMVACPRNQFGSDGVPLGTQNNESAGRQYASPTARTRCGRDPWTCRCTAAIGTSMRWLHRRSACWDLPDEADRRTTDGVWGQSAVSRFWL